MLITPELIHDARPCSDYPMSRLVELGGKGLTPREVAALPIPARDRLWVLTRSALWVNLQRDLVLLAADYCDDALPIFEAKYPDDLRVRNCIATLRRFAGGDATADELRAAAYAADASRAAYAAAMERYVLMAVERLEKGGE